MKKVDVARLPGHSEGGLGLNFGFLVYEVRTLVIPASDTRGLQEVQSLKVSGQ